ncbi:MAG: DUF2167 domain-containing protein [Gallionellaceae bacterium]|jgi:uncharacterized membrane-anchored protein|nr:DUF2167 domain-containing protein [Gallionellaceae bacterium]
MKKLLAILLFLPFVAFAQQPQQQNQSQAQSQIEQELSKLQWQKGPTKGVIGSKGTIDVPQDYVFLDEANTRKFIVLMGNPPRSDSYLIAPKTLKWFAIFEFDDTGYIKDDEKIDPDELLKQLKASDAPSNEQRKQMHMPQIYTDGWVSPPHYDSETKRLEWGTLLHFDSGEKNVNYTSRILGRSGVMSATLVSTPDAMNHDMPEFKQALTSFSFNQGQQYADFRKGDKVAEYGLAALILGGAAAVATKKGFWAALGGALVAAWKLIAAAVVALIAWVGRIFKKKQ